MGGRSSVLGSMMGVISYAELGSDIARVSMSMSSLNSSIPTLSSDQLSSRQMGLPPLILRLTGAYLRVIVCPEGVWIVSGSEPSVQMEMRTSGALAVEGGTVVDGEWSEWSEPVALSGGLWSETNSSADGVCGEWAVQGTLAGGGGAGGVGSG